MKDLPSKEQVIDLAVGVLAKGGVIIHPTATVYGFACLVDDAQACDRIREIKGNSLDKAMLVLTDSWTRVNPWLSEPNEIEKKLMSINSSLSITLLLDASPYCPPGPRAASSKIGIRRSRHPIVTKLIDGTESALVSTSANFHGQSPSKASSQLDSKLVDEADYLVKDDTSLTGVPSCLLSVDGSKIQLLRSDETTKKFLEDYFGPENIVDLST